MSDALVPAVNDAPSPYPIQEFEAIIQACDPGEPLEPGDTRRVDLTALRSGVGVKRLQNTLRQRPAAGKYHHCLLCGHRGSGKSTELRLLQ
jgi:hypothetical protein